MAIKNISYSMAQDRGPGIHQLKRAFILLLTFTFLLFAIAYASDFSFDKMMFSPSFIKVMNRTHEVIENIWTDRNQKGPLATLPSQLIEQRCTTMCYHVAHPNNYHFIMDEPDKCKQNPFLVLMVPVAPNQIEARNAIRSTWGNESTVQGKAVVTLFLVGLTGGSFSEIVQQQLEEESQEYRDLLQSNFVDSYFNLTIKTMVIMDWLATRCPQANFSMKIDSDMFLNLDNLMTLLLAPNTPRLNYITGFLMWNRPVVRDKNSKWYVSEEMYPEPIYPTYLLGMGYVFSNDLPEKIVEASKATKPFNIEDAYVGACLKHLGVAPSSPPDPSQFRVYLHQYVREDFLRVITTILGSPQQLIDIWKDVKNPTLKHKPTNKQK